MGTVEATLSAYAAMGIRVFRVRSGFTREELAAKIGKSPDTIGEWEAGSTRPTPAEIVQLSQLLRVPALAFDRPRAY